MLLVLFFLHLKFVFDFNFKSSHLFINSNLHTFINYSLNTFSKIKWNLIHINIMLKWWHSLLINIGQWASLILRVIQINCLWLYIWISDVSKLSFFIISMFYYDSSIFYYLGFSLHWRMVCILLVPLLLVWDSSSRRDWLTSLLWLRLSLNFSKLVFCFNFSNVFIPVVDNVVKIAIVLPWRVHSKSIKLSSCWWQIVFIWFNLRIELNSNFCCLRPVDDVIRKNSNLQISSKEVFVCKILMRLNLFLNLINGFSHNVWIIVHSKLVI